MKNNLEKARAWDKARYDAGQALLSLNKINTRSDIGHAQADNILTGFVRSIGFEKLADKFENLRDEQGWSYDRGKS